MNQFDLDKKAQETGLKEECGVFGIYDLDGGNAVYSASMTAMAMMLPPQSTMDSLLCSTEDRRAPVSL